MHDTTGQIDIPRCHADLQALFTRQPGSTSKQIFEIHPVGSADVKWEKILPDLRQSMRKLRKEAGFKGVRKTTMAKVCEHPADFFLVG